MIAFHPYEVSRYYGVRCSSLPQRGKRWRGKCPLHGGKDKNFEVNPITGRSVCYSQCGPCGDMIAFEQALTGAGFVEARRAVFAIVGRHDPALPLEERRRVAAQAKRDRHDLSLARFWQKITLKNIDADLEREKAHVFGSSDEPTEQEGAFIGTLTSLQKYVRNLHGPALLSAYRTAMASDPVRTRRLVLEAADDEANAKVWTTLVVRILESATRMDDAEAA